MPVKAQGYGFEVDRQTSRAVLDIATSRSATTYTVLQAAFLALLHAWTGRTDFLLTAAAAGRTRREFERTVGWLANHIVFRTQWESLQLHRSRRCDVQILARSTGASGLPDNPILDNLRTAGVDESSAIDQVDSSWCGPTISTIWVLASCSS